MEQQLHANNIRVKILEQENMTLNTSLAKLREMAQNNGIRVGLRVFAVFWKVKHTFTFCCYILDVRMFQLWDCRKVF